MKPNDLVATLLGESSDERLIHIAQKAGETLFGSSSSGLVFLPEIRRLSYADYENSSEDGAVVDTFDYVFFPSSGRGIDASEEKLSKKHVDVDGKIYLGGASGVTVISDPFVTNTKNQDVPTKELARFKAEVLSHFPKATFTAIDKWGRIFAYVGSEMRGQFMSKNGHSDANAGKPAWLIHDDSKTIGEFNW